MTTKALFLTALLACLYVTGRSQVEKKIDSLTSFLQGKVGNERTRILCDIARSYGDVNNELAYKYAILAQENANKSNDVKMLVTSVRITAQVLRRLGKIDSAIRLFDDILPIARQHEISPEVNTILNSLGVAYLGLAKYDQALVYFFELLQKDIDQFWRITLLHNVGLVYQNLEDFDSALSYYYQSLALGNEIGHVVEKSLRINISLCLAHKGKFAEARALVAEVFSDCVKDCSEDTFQLLFNSLGVIAFLEGNYADAERDFQKSYELSKKTKNASLSLENLAFLVKIDTHFSGRNNTEKYLKEIDNLVSQGIRVNHQIILAYLEVIAIYEGSKDFEKLAYYQKKYISLRDSVFNQRLTTNLMKIEAEYLEKENKAKIESQNKILALNEEVIFRQKYLNLFIALFALLLIVLTTVLFKSNRQKQKMNWLLDKKVRERTIEIESNCDALQRAYEERDLVLEKTSIDINISLATVKGLCSTGLKDVDDPLALQYLNRMNAAMENFSNTLNRLQLRRNNVPVS